MGTVGMGMGTVGMGMGTVVMEMGTVGMEMGTVGMGMGAIGMRMGIALCTCNNYVFSRQVLDRFMLPSNCTIQIIIPLAYISNPFVRFVKLLLSLLLSLWTTLGYVL